MSEGLSFQEQSKWADGCPPAPPLAGLCGVNMGAGASKG